MRPRRHYRPDGEPEGLRDTLAIRAAGPKPANKPVQRWMVHASPTMTALISMPRH
jgi:integrase